VKEKVMKKFFAALALLVIMPLVGSAAELKTYSEPQHEELNIPLDQLDNWLAENPDADITEVALRGRNKVVVKVRQRGGNQRVAVRGGGNVAVAVGGRGNGAVASAGGGVAVAGRANVAAVARVNSVAVVNRGFSGYGHNNFAFRGGYGYGYGGSVAIVRSATYAYAYQPTIAIAAPAPVCYAPPVAVTYAFAAYAAPVYGYAAYGYAGYGCGVAPVVPTPAPTPLPIEGPMTGELRLFRETLERHATVMERHIQSTDALHRTLKGGGKQD
jgi:hypothetical protein